ncbi:MAG: helix-turn-helix domain-containing protein, partial [Maribacter sp.]
MFIKESRVRKVWLGILFVFSLLYNLSAQSVSIELEQRIDSIYELSVTDYKKSIIASQKLLEEIDDFKEPKEKVKIYLETSNVMLFNGEIKESIINLKKAITLSEEKSYDKLYLQANIVLAKAYVGSYEYENAFNVYSNIITTEEYSVLPNDHSYKWVTMSDFAHLNSIIGRKSEALKLYIDSYRLGKDSINNVYWQRVSLDIADLYNFFGKKDSAQIYLREYHELTDTHKPTLVADYIPWYEGNFAFYNNDFKKAIKKYKKYEELIKIDFGIEDEEILIRKGRSYVELGKLDNALITLEAIQEIDEFSKFERYLNPDYYRIYYDVYSAKGQQEIASAYLKKYDQAQQRRYTFAFKTIDELHNLKTKEVQVKENVEKSKLQQYIKYLLFALGTLCIVFIIVFTIKQRREKKKFEALMLKFKDKKSSVESKSISIDIKDEKVAALIGQIKELQEQGFFLKQKTTLHNTAKKLKTNTSYLSTIINTHLGTTFSAFVNEIRIDYIINELKTNKQLRSYSVKAIAEEIGYK